MTAEREFNASNVEEAIEKASVEFGVASDEIRYRILDKGSEGFLGIGVRDARVLVEVPDLPSDNPAEETPEDQEPPGNVVSNEAEDPPNEPSGIFGPQDELSALETGEVPEGPEITEDPISDETLEEVRSLATSFVSAMGFEGRVDVYETSDAIAVDVASDHAALLIGQKGETLDSLQHLLNCAAYQQTPLRKRITLDSEGYRQRRVEALQGMAHRTARKAVRENRETHLPPMASTERRIVHLYLESDEKVSTYSEGSGDQRRVVISPSTDQP
ncbi:RNA-binding cell elongation regulator Jag/EloR [Rubrobacter indicoceani]|uniref:RNA-binding cell elongation regulator Jag/EloR n=1 Tax=Rubrobacter indicoceani TaxID=2051957 RepID=UPI000E5A2652|nr:RNA-binding cell elongation regulator Jag/EloR [Rubrobacter indicoceani]